MNITKRISKVVAALLTVAVVLANTAMPTLAAAKHKVTFLYGTKSYSVMVDNGCSTLPPTDTYVPGYIFAGWVGNATNVTEDRTILGAYTKVDTPAPAPAPAPAPTQDPCANTYHVNFVDTITGATYYSQTVSEGADANPPEVPHHDGYHFEYYDGSFTNVTSDRTIYVYYGRDLDWHDDPSEYWWLYQDPEHEGYQDYWWM